MTLPLLSCGRRTAAAMLFLLLSLGCKPSSTSTLTGRYVHINNPENYLQLEADGRLHLRQQGTSVDGTYAIQDGQITLTFPMGRDRGTVRGDTLIDSDGERWVKQ